MALSPREKEVLSLLAQGMSNAAIGSELFISPVTVKVHVRHIFEKLGVKSRAAAATPGDSTWTATKRLPRLRLAKSLLRVSLREEVEVRASFPSRYALVRGRKDRFESCHDCRVEL